VWTVHGAIVDYVACGETRWKAIRNYTVGLNKTIAAHKRKFGNIDRLIKK
jgi:hypothetical protein